MLKHVTRFIRGLAEPVSTRGWSRTGGGVTGGIMSGSGVRAGRSVPRSGTWSSCAAAVMAGGLAALFLGVGAPAALAQRPAPKPIDRSLLRPLYADSMDIARGQHLAQHFCDDCHGASGISTIPGVPNLAGQRGPYLYSEMRAFLSGARGNDVMNGAITYLSADAMIDVAAYYATLTPASPAPASSATAEVNAVQAGKAAAAACAGCHGQTGITSTPGVPSLVGQDPKYLVTAMTEYKDGARKSDTMKSMVASLSESTMHNIALFFALQKPARASTPAKGNPAAGESRAAPCAACHGTKGVSGNPATPSLAGQDTQYLAAALHGYKDGTRSNTTMKALVAGLSGTAIENLAAYYASLQPQPPNVRKPLSTAEWVQRCDRCHGVNGNSTDPLIPALAAQHAGYLEQVLNAYRKGTRRSAVMQAMADGLSENDIRNLANFYARQPARAVVYVPVAPR